MSANATSPARHLLLDESPMVILPALAEAIGLNEAIVVQQLHFLLQNPKNGELIQGVHYIYNTYPQWTKQFRFWSEPTIKRTFLDLEKKGLVKAIQPDKGHYDRRKYYTIDYDAFSKLTQGLGSPDRDTQRSVRVDQHDPLGTDQSDPLSSRQRKPEKRPPTPKLEFGGHSSFPGEKADSPKGSTVHGGGAVPRCKGASRRWAEQATDHPAAPAFLALAGLTKFPASGRQPLARAFVGRCEDGVINVQRLGLLTAVRAEVNLPRSPDELIKEFDALVADAREAAQDRITELERRLIPSATTSLKLMEELASADGYVEAFTPEDLFGTELSSPFPRWALLVCGRKRGWEVAPWLPKLRACVVEELTLDAGIPRFLHQVGFPLENLGLDGTGFEVARGELHAEWGRECERLKELLHDGATAQRTPGFPDQPIS